MFLYVLEKPFVKRLMMSVTAPTCGDIRSRFAGTLHRRLTRDSVFSESASNSIELLSPGEGRARHVGEFPAEIGQLRFIQPIVVHGGHARRIP
jgi:hypothetical protein